MNVFQEVPLSKYARLVGVSEDECKDHSIKQALQKLDAFERTCLLLHMDGSFTAQDIAEIVEKSQSMVEQTLKEAREHLRHFYYLATQQDDHQSEADQIWSQLYSTLRPSVLAWIYSSGVAAWRGQESDVADDILQETVIRVFKYEMLVEHGKVSPIHSIISFSRTVARNLFQDLRRRERRVSFPQQAEETDISFSTTNEDIDPSEIAIEALSHLALLTTLIESIESFPRRQRTALLMDLANHLDSSDEDNLLQAAFLAAGINLHHYRSPLPPDLSERRKHIALLSMAYKQLKQRLESFPTPSVLRLKA